MNYVGKEVINKAKYGKGIIVDQDDYYIHVRFESVIDIKKFSYPICFKNFLQLQDPEEAAAAKKEAEEREKKDIEEALIKRQEAQAKLIEKAINSKTNNSGYYPIFSTVEDFFVAQERSVLAEISYFRLNGGKRIKIFDGKMVDSKHGQLFYSFETESELNFPDNTQVSFWPLNSNESIPATVIDCEDFTVIIASSVNIGETIPVIEISAEPWRLLYYLNDRLKKIQDLGSNIVKSLICDGYKSAQISKEISKGQETASLMSITQPITFIWGPPGTGKTETLANIALQHIKKGYRVLMLSYSNVSVDGATWRVYKKDSEKQPGKLVRYGYPKDAELLRHEYLTSYNLTLKNHPDLMQERVRLIDKRRHVSRVSDDYVTIGQRLTQIRRMLASEEKSAVNKAVFVATTVSKAIADSTIYDSSFDTVIFDEASMAYIPQIIFSAALAKKHFICMGDFAQLPPIVQSGSNSMLNIDIFKYCGIVDAVERGYGHEWLCMLDTQYRMHPDIASFSSRTMYNGLLKSGPNLAELRKEIVSGDPFADHALYMVDMSGMMSVCTKTADKSRINVLSGMISMGLAIKAANRNEVGIITPYNAQSRLLHAMSRDVSEQFQDIHHITCATVHQFQGSEKDVIIYDAVDCYRMQYPGMLLTSMTNNYANRLYNVALTRAKGKMITVANINYMENKNISKKLVFQNMMGSLKSLKKMSYGDDIINKINSKELTAFDNKTAEIQFINDLLSSHKEVSIDVPGGMDGGDDFLKCLAGVISELKTRGIRIIIRTDDKQKIPEIIRDYVIVNTYITDPIALIDRATVWYGMPFSRAEFITEGYSIPTKFRPILRFRGKHFAQALYGFLNMNMTIDSTTTDTSDNDEEHYHTFASYIAGEIVCPVCGGAMQLKKSKKNKYFIACSNYPKCRRTEYVEPRMVEDYFYLNNEHGKKCPRDNTTLTARIGKNGIYICCSGIDRHFYNLDEI